MDVCYENDRSIGDEKSQLILQERRRLDKKLAQLHGLLGKQALSESTIDGENQLFRRIRDWIKFKEIDFDLSSDHMYLNSDLLDSILRNILPYGMKNIWVVNPYVEKCGLTDLLLNASISGVDVRLITRSPELGYEGARKHAKIKYHNILKDCGAKLFYNDTVHAKIVIVDHKVAIISSMNLYSESTAGKLWEAGIITVDNGTVESIVQAFHELERYPETRPVINRSIDNKS